MANIKFIKVDTDGSIVEKIESLISSGELASSTDPNSGAALVGVDSSDLTNITGSDLKDILESIDDAIGDAGDVDSVNGMTGVVVVSANDLLADHTAVNYNPSDTKISGHLAGIDTKLGSISTPFNYKGVFDASNGDFSAISPASVGDWYKVSVSGIIDSIDYQVGDNILINKDVSGTVVSVDVDKIDNTDRVLSVNGLEGVIVLTSTNINSLATINSSTPASGTITGHLEALDGSIVDNAKNNLSKGFVAAVTISKGDPVYVDDNNEVRKCDASSDNTLEYLGVSSGDYNVGDVCEIVMFGSTTSMYSGLNAGGAVYVADGGGVTQTQITASGKYSLRIGKALTSNEVSLELKNVAVKRGS